AGVRRASAGPGSANNVLRLSCGIQTVIGLLGMPPSGRICRVFERPGNNCRVAPLARRRVRGLPSVADGGSSMASVEASGTRPPSARQVAAIAAGNALEFYDFLTYSFFAVHIGATFFP